MSKRKNTKRIPPYAVTVAERMKRRGEGEGAIARALIQRDLPEELVPEVLKLADENQKAAQNQWRGQIERQRAAATLKRSLIMLGLGFAILLIFPDGGISYGIALVALAMGAIGCMGAGASFVNSWI